MVEIADYSKISAFSVSCGLAKESLDGNVAFCRVEMASGVTDAHYHKKTTEYYLVTAGKGILRIKVKDGNTSETMLNPDIVVKIEPNEIHQTKNLGGLVVEAITNPAWTSEDEIYTDDNLFE